jgi:ATP-binding cassette subfamily C protein CydD
MRLPTLWLEARNHLLRFSAVTGMALANGVMALLQAYWMAKIVNAVFLLQVSLADVFPSFAYLLVVMLARAVFIWGGGVTAARFALAVKEDMRERLITHLFLLGPVSLRRTQTGELLNLLTAGIDNLGPYFTQYLPQLITVVIIPLLIFAVILPLDTISALVLVLTAPCIPVFMVLIGRWAEVRQRRQWDLFGRLAGHYLDMLQGLTVLKLFGRSKEQVEIISRLSRRLNSNTMGVLQIAFLSSLTLELLATISIALIAVTIGLRLLNGTLLFEQGFLVLLLAPEFYLPLRSLGAHYHAGLAGMAAAEKMYAILTLPFPNKPHQPENFAGDRQRGITFQDVSYGYQGRAVEALVHVSFAVNPGEKVAVVGPSGSGKSTVAALLLGFIQPESGCVTIAGIPAGAEQLLSQLTYIPQYPYVLSATVADNIRLGREEATMKEIEEAAVRAGAHNFIMNLPNGYQTWVGEGGAGLSGGERQRLGIARAFVRDTQYVIVDEPTSGLDPATEAAVNLAFERLFAGKTVVIIAHRITTTLGADRVVVLAGGSVAESGHSQSLLQQRGLYQQLVSSFRGDA